MPIDVEVDNAQSYLNGALSVKNEAITGASNTFKEQQQQCHLTTGKEEDVHRSIKYATIIVGRVKLHDAQSSKPL